MPSPLILYPFTAGFQQLFFLFLFFSRVSTGLQVSGYKVYDTYPIGVPSGCLKFAAEGKTGFLYSFDASSYNGGSDLDNWIIRRSNLNGVQEGGLYCVNWNYVPGPQWFSVAINLHNGGFAQCVHHAGAPNWAGAPGGWHQPVCQPWKKYTDAQPYWNGGAFTYVHRSGAGDWQSFAHAMASFDNGKYVVWTGEYNDADTVRAIETYVFNQDTGAHLSTTTHCANRFTTPYLIGNDFPQINSTHFVAGASNGNLFYMLVATPHVVDSSHPFNPSLVSHTCTTLAKSSLNSYVLACLGTSGGNLKFVLIDTENYPKIVSPVHDLGQVWAAYAKSFPDGRFLVSWQTNIPGLHKIAFVSADGASISPLYTLGGPFGGCLSGDSHRPLIISIASNTEFRVAINGLPTTFVRDKPTQPSFCASVPYSDVINATLNLRGYWPLNEPQGSTTINDLSGHGLDGTFPASPVRSNLGAESLIKSQNKAPGALLLTGEGTSSNSRVVIPSFDKYPGGSTGYTIEYWAQKWDPASGWKITDRVGSSDFFMPNYHLAGWTFIRPHVNGGQAPLGLLDTTIPIPTGRPIHIVSTWDASNNAVHTYINGVDDGTKTNGLALNSASTNNPLYFGHDDYDTAGMSCVLDEIAYYNRPLSAYEVKRHYTMGSFKACSCRTFSTYKALIQSHSPIAYWALDETSGTTFADSSNNNHPGTLSTATNIQVGAPSLLPNGEGFSLKFSGTGDGDTATGHVEIASGFERIPFGSFGMSLESWLVIHDSNTNYFPVVTDGVGAQWMSMLYAFKVASTDKWYLRYHTNPSAWVDLMFYLRTDVLHHIVITYEYRNHNVGLYVNGTQVYQASASGANSHLVHYYSNTAFWLGYDDRQSKRGACTLDEVAYYGYPLQDFVILEHFNAGVMSNNCPVGRTQTVPVISATVERKSNLPDSWTAPTAYAGVLGSNGNNVGVDVASFDGPETVQADSTSVYIYDFNNQNIKAVNKVSRAVSILTTTSGQYSFCFTRSSADGSLYFMDPGLFHLTTAGVKTSLVPGATRAAADYPVGTFAQIYNPTGLAWTSALNQLFWQEKDRCNIRTYSIGTTAVTTIAGNYACSTDQDGAGINAKMKPGAGAAFSLAGNYLFVEKDSNIVSQITPQGIKKRIVGNGVAASTDGPALGGAQLNQPIAIAQLANREGTYLVSELAGNKIRLVADGQVTTLFTLPSPYGILQDPIQHETFWFTSKTQHLLYSTTPLSTMTAKLSPPSGRFKIHGVSEVQVNTNTAAAQLAVTLDQNIATGELIVLWNTLATNRPQFQRIDVYGTKISSEQGPASAISAGDQAGHWLTPLPNGNWWLTVNDAGAGDGNLNGVFARTFDQSGAYCPSCGGQWILSQTTTGQQADPVCVVLKGDQKVACAWHSITGSYGYAIYARIFNLIGVPYTDEIWVDADVSASDHLSPRIAPTGDGGFIVVWSGGMENPSNNPTTHKTCYRVLDSDGSFRTSVKNLLSRQAEVDKRIVKLNDTAAVIINLDLGVAPHVVYLAVIDTVTGALERTIQLDSAAGTSGVLKNTHVERIDDSTVVAAWFKTTADTDGGTMGAIVNVQTNEFLHGPSMFTDPNPGPQIPSGGKALKFVEHPDRGIAFAFQDGDASSTGRDGALAGVFYKFFPYLTITATVTNIIQEGNNLIAAFSNLPHASWIGGTSPCRVPTWTAVTCIGETITEVDLTNFALGGTVTFSKLPTTLTKLWIPGNSFTGAVDWSAVSGFTSMLTFDISNNQFAGSGVTIPAAAAMTLFHIDRNQFSGSVMWSGLSTATALQSFKLYSNLLSGAVDWALIAGLSSLTTLQLHSNAFTGSGVTIPAAASLTVFSVNQNQFSGSVAWTGLSTATSITTLNLQVNALSGTVDWALIAGLSSLTTLQLHSNAFTGTVTVPAIAAMTTFTIYQNQFSGSVTWTGLSTATSLTSLKFYSNLLSGTVDWALIAGLSSLTELQLNSNAFTGSVTIPAIATMRVFDIDQNQFSGSVTWTGLSTATSLTTFKLSVNSLSGAIDWTLISNLPSLEVLQLNSNAFSGLYNFSSPAVNLTHFYVIQRPLMTLCFPGYFHNIAQLPNTDATRANQLAWFCSPTASTTSTISPTITPPPTPSDTLPLTDSASLQSTDSLTTSVSNTVTGCAALFIPGVCFSNIDCFYSLRYQSCQNWTLQQLLPANQLDAKLFPSEADILRPVLITIWGGSWLNNSRLIMVAPTASCPDYRDDLVWLGDPTSTMPVKLRPGQRIRYVFNITDAGVTQNGQFRRPCLRYEDSEALKTNPRSPTNTLVHDFISTIRFLFDPKPEILSCEFYAGSAEAPPGSVFVFAPFRTLVKGNNLRTVDSVALVVGSDFSLCSTIPASHWFPIPTASADRTTSQFSYRIVADAPHVVCYKGNQVDATPVHCPVPLTSAGLPPWIDPIKLRAASSAGPTLPGGLKIIEFNTANCRSANVTSYNIVDPEITAGPLVHPSEAEAAFGKLLVPYGLGETCSYLMKPADNANFISIEVIVNMEFADETEKVFILAPTANVLKPITNVKNSAAGTYDGSCDPTSIAGYSVSAMIVSKTTSSKTSAFEETSTTTKHRLPLADGALVMVCSDSRARGGSQIMVGYKLGETMCPGDCKDSSGTARGICDVTTRSCACFEGYIGADCATYAGCAGVNESAVEIFRSRGSVQYTYIEPPESGCGWKILADNSAIANGPYGVGIQILSAKLSSFDCTSSYILIRQMTHSGEQVKRYCKSSFDQEAHSDTRQAPFLVNATSIYIELKGSAVGDSFSLIFLAASLQCPGTPGPTGFISPQDYCDGFGQCYALDYASLQLPAVSAMGCACQYPYASSTPGETCNSCAFGFIPSSFPDCVPLDICPNNCSGHGTCVERVGCSCDAGWYGRPCQQKFSPVEINNAIVTRLPLDNGTGSDATAAGAINSMILSCEGQPQCLVVSRRRGKQLFSFDGANASASNSSSASSRRRQSNSTGNVTNGTTTPIEDAEEGVDQGLLLNRINRGETVGDYARNLNVSGTTRAVEGEFQLSAWVQVTGDSNGFLIAFTDAWFTNDGQSPGLDAALSDAKDRTLPDRSLRQPQLGLFVQLGVVLNGPNRRVDTMFVNTDIIAPFLNNISTADVNATTLYPKRETWMIVRHFRLDDYAYRLFDGTWRFLSLEFRADVSTGQIQGTIYIDGHTELANPGFVQCVPWLPTQLRGTVPADIPAARNPLIGMKFDGGVFVCGYRLTAALDELRVYNRPLDQTTVVSIGGSIFDGELQINLGQLIAMSVIAFFGIAAAMGTFGGKHAKNISDQQQQSAANNSDVHSNDAESADPERLEAQFQASSPTGSFVRNEKELVQVLRKLTGKGWETNVDLFPEYHSIIIGADILNDHDAVVTDEQGDQGNKDPPNPLLDSSTPVNPGIEPNIESNAPAGAPPAANAQKQAVTIPNLEATTDSIDFGRQEDQVGTTNIIFSPKIEKTADFPDEDEEEKSQELVQGKCPFNLLNIQTWELLMNIPKIHRTEATIAFAQFIRSRYRYILPVDADLNGIIPGNNGTTKNTNTNGVSETQDDQGELPAPSKKRKTAVLMPSRAKDYEEEQQNQVEIFEDSDALWYAFQRQRVSTAKSLIMWVYENIDRNGEEWREHCRTAENDLLQLEEARLCHSAGELKRFEIAKQVAQQFTFVGPTASFSNDQHRYGTKKMMNDDDQPPAFVPQDFGAQEEEETAAAANVAPQEETVSASLGKQQNPNSNLPANAAGVQDHDGHLLDEDDEDDEDENESESYPEMVIRLAAIQAPCDPLENRALLQEINDVLDADKNREKQEAAEDALDVGEAAAAVGVIAIAESGKVDGDNGNNNDDVKKKEVFQCPPKMLSTRIEQIRSGWQIFSLTLANMKWPIAFTNIWGGFAGFLALNFGLAFNADFQVTFYLTCGFGIFCAVYVAAVVARIPRRTTKQVESDLRKYLALQIDHINKGESTSRERTWVTKVLWVNVFLLTTLYLPVFSNCLIVLSCHPSIQCLYDCYNEDVHVTMFYFAIFSLLIVGLITPVIIVVYSVRKMHEFRAFVGPVDNATRDEELWELFTRADPDPFAMVYDSYRLKYAYFAIGPMILSACMAIVMVSSEPNSVGQLTASVFIEVVFLVVFALFSPFTLQILNTLTLVSQSHVVLCLALNCRRISR